MDPIGETEAYSPSSSLSSSSVNLDMLRTTLARASPTTVVIEPKEGRLGRLGDGTERGSDGRLGIFGIPGSDGAFAFRNDIFRVLYDRLGLSKAQEVDRRNPRLRHLHRYQSSYNHAHKCIEATSVHATNGEK
jgi:hypothetical protein